LPLIISITSTWHHLIHLDVSSARIREMQFCLTALAGVILFPREGSSRSARHIFGLNTTVHADRWLQPSPVITGAVNEASFVQHQPLSPGSLVSLFGTGPAASTATASTVPLPDSIAGVSVTFSGITAPLGAQAVEGRMSNTDRTRRYTQDKVTIAVLGKWDY
jgi:hypothetical protein